MSHNRIRTFNKHITNPLLHRFASCSRGPTRSNTSERRSVYAGRGPRSRRVSISTRSEDLLDSPGPAYAPSEPTCPHTSAIGSCCEGATSAAGSELTGRSGGRLL